jgi:predicted RNase H-like HicB family nuclease
MKLTIAIYQDEDGAFIAECPAIPGCVSQGASQAEAESNLAGSNQTSKTPSARA